MIDLSDEELDRLYEGSKDDRYIIVGSEVRQMVGMIRRFELEVQSYAIRLSEKDVEIEKLEVALRKIERAINALNAMEAKSWEDKS
jgi:hypothetical protein